MITAIADIAGIAENVNPALRQNRLKAWATPSKEICRRLTQIGADKNPTRVHVDLRRNNLAAVGAEIQAGEAAHQITFLVIEAVAKVG